MSHVGHVRRTNQDAWGMVQEAGVFAVCDGMGGVAGGEIASQAATESFLERISVLEPSQRTERAMASAVTEANRRVRARAAQEPALHGMGTTLVGLAVRERHEWLLAHVGDSRCYLWRSGVLSQCTADHSLVGEQMRMGRMTAEQAAVSPVRNLITRAVGTRRSVQPEMATLRTEPGDLLLLCTDGLTRELPDARIAALLTRHAPSPEACCRVLMDAALAEVAGDNVTCLVVAVV